MLFFNNKPEIKILTEINTKLMFLPDDKMDKKLIKIIEQLELIFYEFKINLSLINDNEFKLVIPKRKKRLESMIINLISKSRSSRNKFRYIFKLKKRAGDDWLEMLNNYKLFKTFKICFDEEELRKKGKVPISYTSTVYCKSCNQNVFLPAWNGQELLSCYWCYNRIAGLPVPIPQINYLESKII